MSLSHRRLCAVYILCGDIIVFLLTLTLTHTTVVNESYHSTKIAYLIILDSPSLYCTTLHCSTLHYTLIRSEEVLNALAAALPEIVGGSADLTSSNLTNLKVTVTL